MTWTERKLLDLLALRYANDRFKTPQWAFLEHVRNDAGWNASRTIDALAMNLYPGKGLALHAFEVKVSRSDWRRELADPTKAQAFTDHVDYFHVVAPKGVVPVGELPPGWGLLETQVNGLALRARVPAQPLRLFRRSGMQSRIDPINRGLVAAMLRAASRTTPLEAIA